MKEGGGNRNPLTHTLRILLCAFVCPVTDFEMFNEFVDLALTFRLWHVVQSADIIEEFPSGEFVVEKRLVGNIAKRRLRFDGLFLNIKPIDYN